MKPDLILVTESWCNNSITDAFLAIDGYDLQPDLRLDRGDTGGGRGGGLLVYGKTGLTILKTDNQSDFDQHVQFKVSDVNVCLLYRSPNSPPEAMARLAALIRGARENTVFIGDFNVPDINWTTGESSARTAELVEAVADAAMEQMVPYSTQVRGNILDLVLTNIPDRIREVSDEGRLGSSDHVMIRVSIEVGPIKPVVKVVKNWRRANWDEMRRQLAATNWRREFRGKEADQMWDLFKGKVTRAVQRHVPTKAIRSNGKPAWMRGEIMAALRKKKKLWLRARRGGVSDQEEYKAQV